MMNRMRLGVAMLSAVAVLGGCKDGTGPRHGDPARVEVIAGSGQQGTVGQPLPQPVQVRVVDAAGRPVPDEVVNFVVTGGGGSVSAGSVTTDDDGIAATSWTLGTSTGTAQTLEARVGAGGGQTLVSEPVTATPRAGAPARMEAASDTVNMSGAVGGPARDSLAVRVLDALGNPVPGADISWTTTGGGTSPARSTTNALGIARTQWTLGPRTDLVQGVTASGPGLNSITFTGRAASRMTVAPSPVTTFTPGATIPVAVVLAGDFGALVQGVRVQWTVVSGGGTVSPASSITGPQGRAEAQWTLGSSGGTQTLRATAGPLQQDITVQVIASGTRTLAAQVPGRVLDATADRVLWFDSAGGTRLIKIRDVAAGTDVTVKADSETVAPVPLPGFLFPGGAFVSNAQGHWFEWRGGTLTGLGQIHSLSVEGDWAAWGTDAAVVRRQLPGGAPQVIYNVGPSDVDVGPDGDVAFIVPGQALAYRDGAITFVSGDPTPPGGRVRDIATDGVNVVFVQRFNLDIPAALYLDRPSADEFLVGYPTAPSSTIYYRLAGGWIAYSTNGAPVRRRSPAGTVEVITNEPTNGTVTEFSRVQALAPDGTLVYSDPALDAYVLVTPGGTRHSLGPAAPGERVEWRGDRFLLISGGSVYRLGA